jgi:ribosome-binding factor A
VKADGRRPQRVAEHIREALSYSLRSDLSDPRLVGVVVTRVDIGSDLAVARCWVRLLIGDEDAKRRRLAVSALNGAVPRLRRQLGPALGLKRVPELRFEYDLAPDHRARVDEILAEIDRERAEED